MDPNPYEIHAALQAAKKPQNQYRPIVVLNVRRMHHDCGDQPERLHDNVGAPGR